MNMMISYQELVRTFLRETVTPSNGYKFFGFDVENDYIAGFESGAWGENF